MLNFDHFWRENSNSNRNQFIIITINSFIFDKKIQIHNFVIFPKIEFLNTIWDVQTVCRPCVYCNLFPLLSLVLSWGSQSSPGTIVIKLLFWGMQHHLLRDLFSFFPSFPHKSLVGLVLYPRNSSNIFHLFLCMLSFRGLKMATWSSHNTSMTLAKKLPDSWEVVPWDHLWETIWERRSFSLQSTFLSGKLYRDLYRK